MFCKKNEFLLYIVRKVITMTIKYDDSDNNDDNVMFNVSQLYSIPQYLGGNL